MSSQETIAMIIYSLLYCGRTDLFLQQFRRFYTDDQGFRFLIWVTGLKLSNLIMLKLLSNQNIYS